jgi:three-Cys-motif partner protein
MSTTELPQLFPSAQDSQLLPEIGPWADQKYRLLRHYAEILSTAMRGKWGARAYVDIFAGAGRARIKGSTEEVQTSPLIALSVPHPFDHYIFCDLDDRQLAALRSRVQDGFPTASVTYLQGDSQELVPKVRAALPRPPGGTLVLCFADPFRLRNLRFPTLQSLAAGESMDFLVLLPTGMDARRNTAAYTQEQSTVLDDALGTSSWRRRWEGGGPAAFSAFVAQEFTSRMEAIGFAHGGFKELAQIKWQQKNLPLYHLGFFSRHELGGKFWKEARRYGSDQQDLFR